MKPYEKPEPCHKDDLAPYVVQYFGRFTVEGPWVHTFPADGMDVPRWNVYGPVPAESVGTHKAAGEYPLGSQPTCRGEFQTFVEAQMCAIRHALEAVTD